MMGVEVTIQCPICEYVDTLEIGDELPDCVTDVLIDAVQHALGKEHPAHPEGA